MADVGMTWKMETRREIDNDVAVLTFRGRLGSEAAPALAESLNQARAGSNTFIIIDLEGVDYVGSAALRVLAEAGDELAKAGGRLLVCTAIEPVKLAFALAGLSGSLTVEPSRAAAMARLRAGSQPIRS